MQAQDICKVQSGPTGFGTNSYQLQGMVKQGIEENLRFRYQVKSNYSNSYSWNRLGICPASLIPYPL